MSQLESGVVIETPSPVSCMDIVESAIVLGCEDGSVRRYDLPETKVQKALMGGGNGISWIQFSAVKGEEGCVWLATGMDVSTPPS